MATYKVIQDIEAEDKFIGPLTLKQFIFAAGAVLSSYLGFFSVIKGAWFMLIIFAPIAFLGFFLAIPWSKEQPTEVWVLAKLRFRFKPRKRIWNQDGIQELVTITVPKKVERFVTNNLSETEVTSRLKALADTIDSRGWAVKNVGVAAQTATTSRDSDRLLSPTILPQQVSDMAGSDISDPMDVNDSPVAATFSKMINDSGDNIKTQALESMDKIRQGGPTTPSGKASTMAGLTTSYNLDPLSSGALAPAAEEMLITEQLKKSSTKGSESVGHLHGIPSKAASTNKAQASRRATPSPDIINLSRNNDLDVKTISRVANRDKPDDNEVVISLH